VDIDAQAARDSTGSDIWLIGVRRLVVANGPNIFQMLLVIIGVIPVSRYYLLPNRVETYAYVSSTRALELGLRNYVTDYRDVVVRWHCTRTT